MRVVIHTCTYIALFFWIKLKLKMAKFLTEILVRPPLQSTQQDAVRETAKISSNKRAHVEDNLVNVGGFSLSAEAAALQQRAFEVMMKEKNENSTQQERSAVAADRKGKAAMKPEPVGHEPKATIGSDIPESSKNAAQKENCGKVPYCFCCKTKLRSHN
jgi:hypothetical protein